MHWLIGISILSLLVTVPHAVQELARGGFMRLGTDTFAGGLLLASLLVLQCWGLVLAARGRVAGVWLHVLVAVLWIGGDLAVYGHAMLARGAFHLRPRGYMAGWSILLTMVFLILSARQSFRTAHRRRY